MEKSYRESRLPRPQQAKPKAAGGQNASACHHHLTLVLSSQSRHRVANPGAHHSGEGTSGGKKDRIIDHARRNDGIAIATPQPRRTHAAGA